MPVSEESARRESSKRKFQFNLERTRVWEESVGRSLIKQRKIGEKEGKTGSLILQKDNGELRERKNVMKKKTESCKVQVKTKKNQFNVIIVIVISRLAL